MARSVSCAAQRNAAVLVWLPLFLFFPLFDLSGDALVLAGQVALLALVAAATLVAVLTSRSSADAVVDLRSYAAWSLLVLATTVASAWGDGWLPLWGLAAIVAPAVLRGRLLAGVLGLVVAGSVAASWWHGARGVSLLVSSGGTLLAAVSTLSFLRLTEAVAELRRTREELARVAVAEERERFSRDLHDLLGHSLSVMVVKAEAVRRLVGRDAEQAAAHAADIERVGREALQEVRDAVDGMRTPSLADALDHARRALDSARIVPHVALDAEPLPAPSDEALAWVVREATTNVLRHSGADSCRIELHDVDGRTRLTVADDGVGGPPVGDARRGGLDGLRQRLESVGGELAVHTGPDGFRLVASVPGGRP